MCGRFALHRATESLLEQFEAQAGPGLSDWQPSYNIPPGQPILNVHGDGASGRWLSAMRWGLVPGFAPSAAGVEIQGRARAPINARAESVARSPLFRNALRRRRTLVPADAWYEWRTTPRGKQPYALRPAGEAGFAFAGLYEDHPEAGRTCTIITAPAAPSVGFVHPRMPVVLPPEAWARWLDPELTDAAELTGLLGPYPGELAAWPVSRAVNRPANDGPELLDPVPGSEEDRHGPRR